ncbi:L-alanine-DL-glutamate epimerase-like enolase superfamily enzyme [Sphingobacterium allocomposti]|uniref:L-alanine-DL-glutamate epimerase-like enolase superfamily enzyme n=1 Tax=Sphingobacterium allocomposti TaxID=415956 RepID=A0A5S5DQZ9_9SPHI|nr:enolase C-terminal domain-like protein [Sphingobacterium composti Yoo et al. 2007 non Ten et al. 2007]TYP97282.1 L-alanine-DL-glutamate epimerase-like enolase superfamily enzyme [Sphingobacterium composti Yoo et al. 2007 non Ten et al. 2007]
MKRRKFLRAVNIGVATTLLSGPKLFAVPELIPFQEGSQHKDLADHTIRQIKFSSVRLQYPRLVGKNARLDIHGFGPRVDICVIETDQGARGWGSLRGSRRTAEQLVETLKGKKITDVFRPDIGILDAALMPFDTALHDLAGIIVGKPVYAMLGKEQPLLFDCYSGMIYFDDLEPSHAPGGIDKILEECAYDYKLGYRQFKLKIGRGNRWMPFHQGLQRDIEVTKKVAEAFPDCQILVDGNNGFSVDEFIAYMKGISGVQLFWIEEPFHETVADYQRLKAWLNSEGVNTLLADGEADPDQELLRELINQKLLDVHLTDIEDLGFTNWRKLLPELQKLGAKASPHAWGSLLKTHYTAHLSAGLGNTATIEGVTSSSDDVDLSGYKLENGKLVPPSTPGFGMKLQLQV